MTPSEPPPSLGQTLDALHDLLARQEHFAENNRYEELVALLDEVNGHFRRITAAGGDELARHAEKARDVADLFDRLRLKVAQQHEEVGRELRKTQHGRSSLRAYGR